MCSLIGQLLSERIEFFRSSEEQVGHEIICFSTFSVAVVEIAIVSSPTGVSFWSDSSWLSC